MSEEQKQPVETCGLDFFKTSFYQNHLPADPYWLDSPLELPASYDSSNLKNFTIPDFEKNNPFYNVIKSTMETFKIWDSWKVFASKHETGWKFAVDEAGCKTFWNKWKNSSVSCVRGEMFIPYNPQILLGMFL